MPSGFFILMRHFLRVDNVLLKMNDTRYHFETENDYILKEYTVREAKYDELKNVSAFQCFWKIQIAYFFYRFLYRFSQYQTKSKNIFQSKWNNCLNYFLSKLRLTINIKFYFVKQLAFNCWQNKINTIFKVHKLFIFHKLHSYK